jgi:hypothetical protein
VNPNSTALAIALLAAAPCAAQPDTFDPSQFPAIQGVVAQYILAPDGSVDELLLQDGTEVQVLRPRSLELVYAVRPGDHVTIHGLHARRVPMILGMTVTNDVTHVTVVTGHVLGHRRDHDNDTLQVQGVIKAQLHDEAGTLSGVLVQDGTAIDIAPAVAAQLGAQIAVGKTIYVSGRGSSTPLGRAIAAETLGADAASAKPLPHMHDDDDDDSGRGRRRHDRGN